MKGNVALRCLMTGCLLMCVCWMAAQPERLLYFPDTGRAYTHLDPGQEILQRNFLISNQAGNYSVSFSLSFDQLNWKGFALGPRFSTIFNLQGNKGCYIRVRTQFSSDPADVIVVVYYLLRGQCYSMYWNKELSRWDIMENACRAD